MEQVGPNSQVEACHAQGEESTPDACEDCAPKGHTHQLQGCLLEHLAVWFDGRIVNDLAGEVGDQSLSQRSSSPCATNERPWL